MLSKLSSVRWIWCQMFVNYTSSKRDSCLLHFFISEPRFLVFRDILWITIWRPNNFFTLCWFSGVKVNTSSVDWRYQLNSNRIARKKAFIWWTSCNKLVIRLSKCVEAFWPIALPKDSLLEVTSDGYLTYSSLVTLHVGYKPADL